MSALKGLVKLIEMFDGFQLYLQYSTDAYRECIWVLCLIYYSNSKRQRAGMLLAVKIKK